MTAIKRSKNSRQRGTHTHGWGSKKKHRGAGNRGGRGMAGSGKRGDAKKPSVWKGKKQYLGKSGFKKKNIKSKIKSITIKTLIQEMPKLIGKKLAEEKGGVFVVDLGKIGCNKLLSTGNATLKLKITTSYASAKAVEKIKAAGGEVTGIAEPAADKPAKPEVKSKPEEIGTKDKGVKITKQSSAKITEE